jgi:hypothetical protein
MGGHGMSCTVIGCPLTCRASYNLRQHCININFLFDLIFSRSELHEVHENNDKTLNKTKL